MLCYEHFHQKTVLYCVTSCCVMFGPFPVEYINKLVNKDRIKMTLYGYKYTLDY